MTAIGSGAATSSRHLPAPSPRPMSSSSRALSVRAPFGGSATVAGLAPGTPRSSTPRTVAVVARPDWLTSRSRLSRSAFEAGLKVITRWTPSGPLSTTAFIAARKPSSVRRYALTAMGRSLSSARCQSPAPSPTPAMPLAALPRSRSSELKCRTAEAAMSNDVRRSAPASSRARTKTVPARSERLTTRANPCRMPSSAGANSGTVCVSPAASAAVSRKTGSMPAVRACSGLREERPVRPAARVDGRMGRLHLVRRSLPPRSIIDKQLAKEAGLAQPRTWRETWATWRPVKLAWRDGFIRVLAAGAATHRAAGEGEADLGQVVLPGKRRNHRSTTGSIASAQRKSTSPWPNSRSTPGSPISVAHDFSARTTSSASS